ncbi:MAG: sigma-54-dependent Fis family transcriptional regulator [Gammaproteobacteria bacterium]|nr:sigma-54-dependent Fis family transcriptional regulator [Gammaproteobacteria bacterium]
MAAATVMLVEDDHDLREALGDTLELAGFRTLVAENGDAALVQLGRFMPDLIVSDVQMGAGLDGHALLKRVRDLSTQVPVLLMTAYGDVAGAVQAMRDGATDYVQKPFTPDVFLEMVHRHVRLRAAGGFRPVIADARSLELFRMAERVAASDATVMLTGPSGSGKEVLARYIHEHSVRAEEAFVAINCAAIPENMLEATLFGYEKGAFTGAVQAMPGKFEQAEGGTLFLDELGELDLGLQAKLLRVLQEREVERLAGRKAIKLNVRVVAATNRNLLEEVRAGRFREDLFYRLNVFPLRCLALAERRGDILPLSEALLAHQAARMGRASLRLDEGAVLALTRYDWPGNVRELENVLQRAVILANDERIRREDLHFDGEAPALSAAGFEASEEGETGALDETVRAHEFEMILAALQECRGSRAQVSEKLGVNPRTLRYKIAKMRAAGYVIPD